MTIAANNNDFAKSLAVALSGDKFRAYTSDDMVGVEVGGAIKNVLAIGAGISDGLGFGANTRIALITRGLVEMTRLGVALGANQKTFMGLAGMGDLVLTCTDNLSRNRRMGLALGGSLTNAVVLDDSRLLNSTMHFPDEFVRHKLLDLIGDLCLLERPLLGHVMALKAGHDLHGRLVSRLIARTDAWTLVGGAAVSSRAPGAAVTSVARAHS